MTEAEFPLKLAPGETATIRHMFPYQWIGQPYQPSSIQVFLHPGDTYDLPLDLPPAPQAPASHSKRSSPVETQEPASRTEYESST